MYQSEFMPRYMKKGPIIPQKTAKDNYKYIARRILLHKGRVVTPRLASQACAGMTTCDQIVLVMEEMTTQGLGEYHMQYRQGNKVCKAFVKNPLLEVAHALGDFGISQNTYETKFNTETSLDRR